MRDPYATPYLIQRLAEWQLVSGVPEQQVLEWTDRAIHAGEPEVRRLLTEALERMRDEVFERHTMEEEQ